MSLGVTALKPTALGFWSNTSIAKLSENEHTLPVFPVTFQTSPV